MVVTENMKAKWFANGLKEYLFGVIPLTRTSTYSDVLDKTLRFEAPTHIIGSVAQPMGSRTSSRDAQSGMRGQTAEVEDKPGPLC